MESEAELRRRAAEAARPKNFAGERAGVDQNIVTAIGGHCTQENIRQFLAAHGPAELAAFGDELFQRVAATERTLHQRLEQRGRLAAEMKQLADDRQLAAQAIAIGRRGEAVAGPAAPLAGAGRHLSRLLETIRTTYEQQRQPETLQEASGYLDRLTQGRYRRVWTPLGQQVLRVDDAQGHALPVEVLSRGTREHSS